MDSKPKLLPPLPIGQPLPITGADGRPYVARISAQAEVILTSDDRQEAANAGWGKLGVVDEEWRVVESSGALGPAERSSLELELRRRTW